MPIRKNEEFRKHFLADTKEEAENLLKEYDNILKTLARKAANFTGAEFEDLYQEGIIGLARASRDFDDERSDNFKIFAIYKIKDAMREFETTQSMSIKAPQYTKDAIRSANILKECLIKAGEYRYNSLSDMWDISLKYNEDTDIGRSIQDARQKLINLADRSHVPVKQLLERSEIIPLSALEPENHIDRENKDYLAEERDLVAQLDNVDAILRIKEYLSEDEYNLLVNRYVKGMTLRELAPLMGISAAHVSDTTQNILRRLRKIKKRIFDEAGVESESNRGFKIHKQEHTS